MRICFIVTSVIQPSNLALSYTNTRSIFSAQERYSQTVATVKSIRKFCPNSEILLIEASHTEDYNTALSKIVDKIVYIGNRWFIRACVDSKNKSLGEIAMLYFGTKSDIAKYDYIFKISGRYCLNNQFNFDKLNFDKFNIKIYSNTISTRLYGFPGIFFGYWKKILLLSSINVIINNSIEEAMFKHLYQNQINFLEILGIEGLVGPDGTQIKE